MNRKLFQLTKELIDKLPKFKKKVQINKNKWFSDRLITRIDYIRNMKNEETGQMELWLFVHFFVDEKEVGDIENFWKDYDSGKINPDFFRKNPKVKPMWFQKKHDGKYNLLIQGIELTKDLQII